jgi:sugar phosphate permease
MSSYDSDSPTDSVSSSSERRNLISPTSSIDSGEIYSNEVPLSRNPILLALLIGFIGYYFVRSNLTVTLSVILKSLPGVDKAEFGSILSVGYLFYASGKLISGPLIESYGPNKLFVGGLFLGILFNMVFVLVPVTLNKEENHIVNKNQALAFYGFAWGMNRLAQSVGWGSLIKIVSTKFPANIHGR